MSTAREAELRAHYEVAAAGRATQPPDPRRVQERDGFLRLLGDEGRTQVLEVGCGAGHDVAAFRAAGCSVVAIDLAFQHALLAAAAGAQSVQASVLSLPFHGASFEAGWSMSTLLHLPDDEVEAALAAIAAALTPGALLAVGLWGGHDRELLGELDTIEPKRYFRLRTHDHVRSLLSMVGDVERFVTWPDTRSEWVYQFSVVRVPGA